MHCSHQAFGLYNLGFHNGSRFNVPMPLRPTLVRGIAAVFRSARLSLLFVLSVTLHGLVQAQAMPAAAAAVAVEATRLPAVPALVQPAARAAEPAARPGEATAAAPVTTIPARPQPTPLPPEANEFQRFVLTNTGQTLPVFGTEYFQSTGLGYQPADQMPVPADYVLGAGDELLIRGWGTVDIDLRAPIDRGGQIFRANDRFSRIGGVLIGGSVALSSGNPTAGDHTGKERAPVIASPLGIGFGSASHFASGDDESFIQQTAISKISQQG